MRMLLVRLALMFAIVCAISLPARAPAAAELPPSPSEQAQPPAVESEVTSESDFSGADAAVAPVESPAELSPREDRQQEAQRELESRRTERSLEQRVDTAKSDYQLIKVQSTRKKNVTRVDNKPKPKVRPVAIIKGPISPWAYTQRYLAGEVVRRTPRGEQGVGPGQRPGQEGGASAPRGPVSSRRARDLD